MFDPELPAWLASYASDEPIESAASSVRPSEEEIRLALWLHYASGTSARQYRTLLMQLPALPEAFSLAKQRKLDSVYGLGEAVRSRLYKAAESGFLENCMERFARSGIDVLPISSDAYPSLLKEIHDPPQVLFVRGNLPANPALPIAIIGARKCTDYGEGIAELFAKELSTRGATVVSGMAYGADAAAAQGALSCKDAEYPTIAVLGCGVDVIYPRENRKLYEEICARGAVISEFWPGTEPAREHFPIRNRIMSGLSRGVVVVEAGERSGTSITAGFAHDQGREVFAVPGRLTDRMSVGTNRMIQRGEAKPVFCVEDILEEFAFSETYDSFVHGPKTVPMASLSEPQQCICRLLSEGEMDADLLVERSGLSAGVLNSALTALTFSGIMKQLPGRVYALDTLNVKLTE